MTRLYRFSQSQYFKYGFNLHNAVQSRSEQLSNYNIGYLFLVCQMCVMSCAKDRLPPCSAISESNPCTIFMQYNDTPDAARLTTTTMFTHCHGHQKAQTSILLSTSGMFWIRLLRKYQTSQELLQNLYML